MSGQITTEATSLAGIGVISAFTVELLGIPATPILWAAIGSIFGMTFAPKTGQLKRCFIYGGSSLLSALIGHSVLYPLALSIPVMAPYSGSGANVFSALVAVGFHPALSWFVEKVPHALDWFFSFFARKGAR